MDYMTRIATFGGAACLAVFGITGAVAANHPAPQPAISGARLAGATVRTFNDGFTDAKRDDCQQGFQPACRWLRTVNVAEHVTQPPRVVPCAHSATQDRAGCVRRLTAWRRPGLGSPRGWFRGLQDASGARYLQAGSRAPVT